jgi:osmotically-inducible protein OsmY
LEALLTRMIRNMEVGIHVSVRGGHDFLSGAVDDFDTKRGIYSLVRGTSGVREITPNIRVARIAD